MVVALATTATASVLVYRSITRDGDGKGNGFRTSLVDASRSNGLRRPVPLRELAPFDWDAVAVVYPYAEEFAKDDVGDEAKEIPSLSDDEVAVIFIRERHLAGWTVIGEDFAERTGIDGHTCLILDRPVARNRAYVAAIDGRLRFTTRSGVPLWRGGRTCR